jgi:hypothetical protein
LPRNLTIATIEELCLSSGNICAFPDCHSLMYDFERRVKIGEKAQIEAVEKGGPRYDESVTPKDRNSFENLMLMCPNHHTLIDKDPNTYTVQVLKEIKRRHEESQHKRITDITPMAEAFLRETIFNQISVYGLKILPRNYFERYRSTNTDFENWKKGFSFNLESIKAGREFRRNAVLSDIKEILEVKQRVLLLGEMGMSKTTILMEVICDCFDQGYEILYNWGNIEIKNEEDLIEFIEDLLERDEKILIAVDNVPSKKLLPIFYVMERLESHIKTRNLIFLLTARTPDFNLIVKENVFEVQEQMHRNSIQKFRDDNTFHYQIPYFSDKEIQDFINKYKAELRENNEEYLSILTRKAREYSNGYPIMVRYYVIGQELSKSVEDRYVQYLIDHVNRRPDATKIQTLLVCIFLELAGVQIKDELLKCMRLIKYARDLRESLLSRQEDGIWKTLHPRWDMELLAFLFTVRDENLVEERVNYLRNAIQSIFSLEDEKIASAVISTLYHIPTIEARELDRIPIDITENAMQIPSFISSHIKSRLFSLDISTAYSQLGKYEIALDWCNKSLNWIKVS